MKNRIGVKSDIPFDRIELRYTGGSSQEPGGWGITDIRYVTHKAVWDDHKLRYESV